jgi:hypothetical protein
MMVPAGTIGHSAMSNILPFKKPKAAQRHRGNTLCKRGYHQWQAVPGTPFDVKTGKLVTCFRCARCGAERSQAT